MFLLLPVKPFISCNYSYLSKMVVLSIHIKKYPDSKHHLAIVFETKDSAPFLADYVQ